MTRSMIRRPDLVKFAMVLFLLLVFWLIFVKFQGKLSILISKGFVIQKQVKINAGKIERRFGVDMTPFSSSKMNSNKLSGIVAGD